MSAGWQTKTVQSLCEDVNVGHVGPSSMHRDPNGIPFLMGKNIGFGTIHTHNIERVTEKFHHSQPKSKLRVGDIVVVRIGKSGQAAKIPISFGEANCSGLVIIKQPKDIDTDFLVYYLNSPIGRGYSLSQARGSTRLTLNTSSVAETVVPAPSLREQRRIVGILDEAFVGIATAKANSEKNCQNASALFQSHLQSVFAQRGTGWVDRTLDEVCVVERGSSPRPIKEYFTTKSDGVNWIKIGDTEEGGKYVSSTAQKITPKGAKQSRFVKEGDFILTNSMSFGRPYIMKTSGYIHDGWFVLRLNVAIDTDYFYYLLSSPVVQSQFASLASGSVVKNISGDLVKKAVLPIPPLEQQQVIVEKLKRLSEETQRLEALYQRKLAALGALKSSLLYQAFTGKLTTTP